MTRGWAVLLVLAVVAAGCSSGSRHADPPLLIPWNEPKNGVGHRKFGIHLLRGGRVNLVLGRRQPPLVRDGVGQAHFVRRSGRYWARTSDPQLVEIAELVLTLSAVWVPCACLQDFSRPDRPAVHGRCPAWSTLAVSTR